MIFSSLGPATSSLKNGYMSLKPPAPLKTSAPWGENAVRNFPPEAGGGVAASIAITASILDISQEKDDLLTKTYRRRNKKEEWSLI